MRLSDKMPQQKIRPALQAAGDRKTSPKTKPRAEQKPNKETEVKLRVTDRQALLGQLARLRAAYHGRVHEMNTLYDTPGGSLAREGKVLRIRVERTAERQAKRASISAKLSRASRDGQPALLTYKGPLRPGESSKPNGGRRYKIREEREVHVADEAVLAGILNALGLRPCFRYEKYRSTYRLPRLAGATLDLDETPIGDFIEVEGSPAAIDRFAALLGYQPADYITKSYGQLFLDETRGTGQTGPAKPGRIRGAVSRDMLFRGKK